MPEARRHRAHSLRKRPGPLPMLAFCVVKLGLPLNLLVVLNSLFDEESVLPRQVLPMRTRATAPLEAVFGPKAMLPPAPSRAISPSRAGRLRFRLLRVVLPASDLTLATCAAAARAHFGGDLAGISPRSKLAPQAFRGRRITGAVIIRPQTREHVAPGWRAACAHNAEKMCAL